MGLSYWGRGVGWVLGASITKFVLVVVIVVAVAVVVLAVWMSVAVIVVVVVVMAVVIMCMLMLMFMFTMLLLVRIGRMGRLHVQLLRRRRAAAALRFVSPFSRLRWVMIFVPMFVPMAISVSQHTGPPGIRRRSLIGRVVVMHIVMAI